MMFTVTVSLRDGGFEGGKYFCLNSMQCSLQHIQKFPPFRHGILNVWLLLLKVET